MSRATYRRDLLIEADPKVRARDPLPDLVRADVARVDASRYHAGAAPAVHADHCVGGGQAMTGPAPRVDVDALRRSVSLVDLLPADAKPRRIGTDRYRALCPFHAEKTPSMIVNNQTGRGWRFHCFGCGEDGDAIDYVMRTQRVDFRAAVATLGGGRDWLTVATPARRRTTTLMLVCDGRGCGATMERADLLDAVATEAIQGWRRRDDDGRTWCPTCCARADRRRAA